MTDKKTIIITGSSGFIGSELVNFFAAKGWNVRAFQRKAGSNANKNISYHSFSLGAKPDEKSFEGADYIVHCAHQHFNSKNKNADELNIASAKSIIDIARKKNIKILFLSTLSAHSQAESHYGKNKFFLESLFDLNKDLVLKLGLVLGNGGLFGTISGLIKKGKFIPMIGGNKPIQTIDVDDLCLIIDNGISQNISGLFHIAEAETKTLKDLYVAISNQLGKNTTFVSLPLPIAMLIAKTAELTGIPLPVSSESVLGLKHLKSFETKKDIQQFGINVKSMNESVKKYLH